MDNRVPGCQPPAGVTPLLSLGCLLLPVWSGGEAAPLRASKIPVWGAKRPKHRLCTAPERTKVQCDAALLHKLFQGGSLLFGSGPLSREVHKLAIRGHCFVVGCSCVVGAHGRLPWVMGVRLVIWLGGCQQFAGGG